MNNIMTIDQIQSFRDLRHKKFKLIYIISHSIYQFFIVNLNYVRYTL